MKRQHHFVLAIVVAFLCLVLGAMDSSLASQSDQETPEKGQASTTQRMIVKSYTLRFVKPDEVMKAARLYYIDATSHENTLMVRIWTSQVADFEKLLAAIDVEPKTVYFRVYPIVAMRDSKAPASTFVDSELKKVFDAMNALWKFQGYEVLGETFITMRESSGPEACRLVAKYPLLLRLADIKVSGGEPGKRTVTIGELVLSQPGITPDFVYFDTHDVVLKESGYLIAGVGGTGFGESAMILVLSADIR
jgi:hypothetical protein